MNVHPEFGQAARGVAESLKRTRRHYQSNVFKFVHPGGYGALFQVDPATSKISLDVGYTGTGSAEMDYRIMYKYKLMRSQIVCLFMSVLAGLSSHGNPLFAKSPYLVDERPQKYSRIHSFPESVIETAIIFTCTLNCVVIKQCAK
jgi:hypothetical protein